MTSPGNALWDIADQLRLRIIPVVVLGVPRGDVRAERSLDLGWCGSAPPFRPTAGARSA